MKLNYQIEMERMIAALPDNGVRPRLLLHACCAPCSSAVLERLTPVFDIEVFYYNPNIEPEAELNRRIAELQRLIDVMPKAGAVTLQTGSYDNERFHERVRGLEDVPEGGARCAVCFRMRLEETARRAAAGGFDYCATTLTISPLKDAQRLNAIGSACAREYGVAWLYSDFKKKDGYRRSCALSAQYGLYRQDYCGCVYSLMERRAKASATGTSI